MAAVVWNGRTRGFALVVAGTVLWSSAGLFTRFLDLDVWTLTGWRAFFGALSLAAVVVLQHGRSSGAAVRSLGGWGFVAVPLTTVSMVSYIWALKLTTVANVMAVYGTVPFLAAGFAWVMMRERATKRVMIASGVAFLGILLVVSGSLRLQDLAGNFFAFLMTSTFAVVVVIARLKPGMDMAAMNGLGAAATALVALPLMSHTLPSPGDLAVLALFGFVTSAMAFLLFLVGGRLIRASEAGLIGVADVVMGPLWVWLAFGEAPGGPGIVGAAVVILAVGWYLAGAAAERQPLAA